MKLVRIIAAVVAFASAPAFAQAVAPEHAAHHASAAPGAATPTTDGEVRKIDREQGKVTLKHGPIANLDMPRMTMVFKVARPEMLDGIKEGDKVKFAADRVNGAFTVTAIEAAK